MADRRAAPCGSWRSPIAPGLVAQGGVRIGGVAVDGSDVYWVESRPNEGGRNVALRWRAEGGVDEITPPGFNVRSRVHEYGGGAFTVNRGVLFFSNDADRRLYRQEPGIAPVPLSREASFRYADLVVDERRSRLLCVREEHRPGEQPRNLIAAVSLADGGEEVLVEGADFYASPRLSPDGTQLAYLSWNQPQMPWQGTCLHRRTLDRDGFLGADEQVAGSDRESIFAPTFSPRGQLHFVSDRGGWWNLYGLGDSGVEPVCPMEAEFGTALWVFGLSTYAWLDEQTLVCAIASGGTWRLAVLDRPTGRLEMVPAALSEISHVFAAAGRAFFVGASATETPGIYSLTRDLANGVAVQAIHRPSPVTVDLAFVSEPEAISFPTTNGAVSHGLYYAPANRDFSPPPGEKPPLLVLSHGGPTAAASTALNFGIQFWTSRGFAVLDVNYRGSLGYGRAYRNALDGQWGVADVDDCVAGARFLAAKGLVDESKLAIRGGSAGGFTTLAALAFRDVFRAGASLYGISDLEALAKDTHKFEACYLNSLVGPYPARMDLYRARSPIYAVDQLSCPVIFFQGLEDKVVLPSQSERMVEALRRKGLFAPYVTFPDEQHGFRRAQNIARVYEEELAFYARVFGF